MVWNQKQRLKYKFLFWFIYGLVCLIYVISVLFGELNENMGNGVNLKLKKCVICDNMVSMYMMKVVKMMFWMVQNF